MGHPKNSECRLWRIFLYVSLELECSKSQPSKWCRRKSYQIRTKSSGSFILDPSPHRRTMENLSCTSTCLVNQRPLYPSSNGIWEGTPATPNDLLIGNHFLPPVPEEQSKVNPRDLVWSTENLALLAKVWFRTRSPTQKQMVPKEREPERRRSCFGDGTFPQEDMENGSCTRNIK